MAQINQSIAQPLYDEAGYIFAYSNSDLKVYLIIPTSLWTEAVVSAIYLHT